MNTSPATRDVGVDDDDDDTAQHIIVIREVTGELLDVGGVTWYRAYCACGYRSRRGTRAAARRSGQDHARDKTPRL